MDEQNFQMYPKLNPQEFPELFTAHMSAMTTEQLNSKSQIATQLAYRDMQIEKLGACNNELIELCRLLALAMRDQSRTR